MLKKKWIGQLETPCLVIDVRKAKENVEQMQRAADEAGCLLRPHIKTHKMQRFARMQTEAGANGITCAKVSEAEVMADGGLDDIFIAYPMVGAFRIRRAIALAKRVRRLILAADSREGADALQAAAAQNDMQLEVRMEVDTGAARSGIKQEQAVELACYIDSQPNLRLTGIYTFKGLVLEGKPTMNNEQAGMEEGQLMQKIGERIRSAGVAIADISAGSTPTGIAVAGTKMVTEIRPGTYIFKDYMLCLENAAKMEEIAVRCYATVVSVPCREYAVIDGGTKTFPMDIALDAEPCHYNSYAVVEGRPDLRLRRMNEEHGMLTSVNGETGLKVGDVICMIPVHVCTAVNMQNQVYLYDGEKLWKEKVDARGMLV